MPFHSWQLCPTQDSTCATAAACGVAELVWSVQLPPVLAPLREPVLPEGAPEAVRPVAASEAVRSA
eukprot:CAMPEP_0119111386 /NCGR_PEP_ID=MMETSP1180-20130426/35372_1 /TAXON_ID=3052 ORGANISM="Chlamydomonas cf sp, Strain CCMP681" /NCGR_SAMPLE_ID=MMETSP1180 /ASSEMBLY_ACC=CAM_ASM_000741 /LENGTH=65 /DNA_ID=CAMNT_0007098327 /DNA_START=365 /DNA_END=562 /DNA_ORIENTATION=-